MENRKTRHCLTDEEVHKICKMLEAGVMSKDITKIMDVSTWTICNLRQGRTHRDITRGYKMNEKGLKGNQKLTKEEILKIHELLNQGHTNVEIAKMFNVSDSIISSVRSGGIHSEITGRNRSCKLHGHVNTTRSRVRKICELLEKGYDCEYIAKKLDVAVTTVYSIRRGDTYKDISKEYNIVYNKKKYSKITDEVVENICKLIQTGKTYQDIADRMNVSLTSVYRIKKGLRHRDISSKYGIGIDE